MSDLASGPGQPPELAWLPVDKLRPDERYQRTLDTRAGQALIKRIAANFKWAAFQALLAAPVDPEEGGRGGWWIIDGQHRVAAARLAGIAHVPAVVVRGDDVAALARAFVTANADRLAVNPFAKHRARRVADDPEALAIDAMCAKYGIRIASTVRRADELKPGETLALAQFRALPKRYGAATAGYAIEIIARAYRDQPGGLRAAFFQGAALWLHTKIDGGGRAAAVDRAVRALSSRGPLAEARSRRQRAARPLRRHDRRQCRGADRRLGLRRAGGAGDRPGAADGGAVR